MRGAQAELRRAIKKKSKEIPRDGAPLLYFKANGRLDDLFQLAKKGDREAARYLLSVLTANVDRFLILCSEHPTLAREIRSPRAPWPLLHTQLKMNRREGCLTVPKNHVLRQLGVIRAGRGFSEVAVGTRIAKQLYAQMEFYRGTAPRQKSLHPLLLKMKTPRGKVAVTIKRETLSASNILRSLVRNATEAQQIERFREAEQIERIRALKPLCRSNYVDWWRAGEPLFINWWGAEFQDHEDFKDWSVKRYAGLTTKQARSTKRSDIIKAIKRGFESLAKHLQQSVPNHQG